MNANMIFLVLWTICGVLTLVAAALEEEHKISVWSYFWCWIALMLNLIDNIITR